MTDEDHDFEVVRRFNAIGHGEDASALDELLAPEFVAHNGPDDVRGVDGWREFVESTRERFGPTEAGVDELIRSGDLIAERWWVRTVEPSPTRAHGITMHRMVDGRIAEQWAVMHSDD